MKNQKDGLKGAIKIMFDSFKDSDEAKSLEYIDLFSLMTNSLLKSPKGYGLLNESTHLEWDREIQDKWAVMFTFGNSLDTGLYYSFASNPTSNSEENVDFEITSAAD